MASKYNRPKAHNQSLLLFSPITMYLLIAEQNSYITTCIQRGDPAGKMERRCRDTTGVAKQQTKQNMLFASCWSETHLPTAINVNDSDFAKAVRA